jgi:DNA-3-methyladenine glycosylase II
MDYSIALVTLKQADPILGAVIDRVGSCRLNQEPRKGELLDALAESIIYQQLSGKAAATIHRRFLQLYPELDLLTTEAILNTPDEILRSAGLSRSKVLYIKDLAQRIQAGLPTIAHLETLEDEAIIQLLTSVKGIGRWTAQMLLIFRLHRWDVLPVDDLGIRTAIRNLYHLEELPDKKTVEQIGQAWKPYQTIASWYLWRSLDGGGRA